ncbi:MAG: hypothetical protein ABIN01_04485 [Ferruginibacter sp.]
MELIYAIQTGTEKAFTSVYNLYHVKPYRYFIKKTKSEEASIELVQIVFTKLWSFRHTLSEEYSFDMQLFNIARTCFIDFIRQQSIQKSRTLNLIEISDSSRVVGPDRTMELILGLPPMTQFDAAATPMWRSFTSQPNTTVSNHLPAHVNLNDKNLAKTTAGAAVAKLSEQFDWSKEDKVPDLVMNEILWQGIKGKAAPSPVHAAFVKRSHEEDRKK